MPDTIENYIASKESEASVWLAEKLGAPPGKRMRPATHVGKYTHPDAGSGMKNVDIAIFSHERPAPKGYLCFGNFRTQLLDFLGTAANIPYAKTLTAVMKDGRTVKTHLEEGTEDVKSLSGADEATFRQWRQSFSGHLRQSGHCGVTDQKLKQVYFAIEKEEYRLFTLLPCSVLIWELKHRIMGREWREEKVDGKAKSKRIAFIEHWQRKFGGTKPQNISFLSSDNGGRARVLPCIPPSLKTDRLNLPTSDFFKMIRIYRSYKPENEQNSLWRLLESLRDTLMHDPNTDWARKKKRGIIRAFIERGVIMRAEQIRDTAPVGWSGNEKYAALPEEQKIWLDSQRENEANISIADMKWKNRISRQIAGFVVKHFERVQASDPGSPKLVVDDAFVSEIQEMAKEYLDG